MPVQPSPSGVSSSRAVSLVSGPFSNSRVCSNQPSRTQLHGRSSQVTVTGPTRARPRNRRVPSGRVMSVTLWTGKPAASLKRAVSASARHTRRHGARKRRRTRTRRSSNSHTPCRVVSPPALAKAAPGPDVRAMALAVSSRILAVLGPTNTGKTHFAVERMLAHRSGIIGFPLRLLAREIFDRIVAIKGPAAVALITGEERVGSDDARYVVCTVEAVPLQREASFLAVDEIQLCADRERGHVFTDRLLHARGTDETMFLGSDTIRPILKLLVPEAEVITRPRFSVLTYAGETKLHRLPRRSAIVGFSASEVYTLAEVVRRQKGGAAVVLGALSPRTRNAQVAMYQAGEVEHLVATDAIGMGLNMDVAHVAFAGLAKFDGNEHRRLRAPEMAQIAGRAGRHMSNGTFGATKGCEPFEPREVEAIESHTFPPLKYLRWRNSELDFTNVETLTASLDRAPELDCLVKVRDAIDHRSLLFLSRHDEVRSVLNSQERVRLLWQVCQIPDFRK